MDAAFFGLGIALICLGLPIWLNQALTALAGDEGLVAPFALGAVMVGAGAALIAAVV